MSREPRSDAAGFRARAWFAFGVLGLAAVGLAVKAVELQLVEGERLIGEGEARTMRDDPVEAHRGAILDRESKPVAISTPMQSVYANPRVLGTAPERWQALARQLKRDPAELARSISSSQDRDFIWLARQLPPAQAEAVLKMNVPGVGIQSEYQRFYPQGEVLGHLLGITGRDDQGLEALELAYDSWLAGVDGVKRVIKDNQGRRVEDIENILAVRPGRDLTLSLDTSIQYLAHRELKRVVEENRATGGSIVVIDIPTGEVLAMANQPAFNPNDRERRAAAVKSGWVRNRAVTDMIEPGSSIKPFVIAAALESGRFDAGSVIDTGNGSFVSGSVEAHDEHPLGVLDLAGVLSKSSNVAMAKIALALEKQQLWGVLSGFGFGKVTASRFPGESGGMLPGYANLKPYNVVSLSRGYNLSVTPLQLAQAYATIGSLGIARPVSLLRVDQPVAGQRVMSERNARTLISQLETVVQEGTGMRAGIPGYRVAGKTGTAWKARTGERGYHQDRYVAVFGGVAPASNPRLATVVVIDDPRADHYYGGELAAPVFAAVTGGALRMMGVAPDVDLQDAADRETRVVTASGR